MVGVAGVEEYGEVRVVHGVGHAVLVALQALGALEPLEVEVVRRVEHDPVPRGEPARQVPVLPAVFIRRCRIGRTKAAVLPLPVIAEARISRPASAGGRAAVWIGVGFSKPMSEIPRTRAGSS